MATTKTSREEVLLATVRALNRTIRRDREKFVAVVLERDQARRDLRRATKATGPRARAGRTAESEKIRALRKELNLALDAIRYKDDQLSFARGESADYATRTVALAGRIDGVERDLMLTKKIAEEVGAIAARHEQELSEANDIIKKSGAEIARLNNVVRIAHARVAEYEADLPALRKHLATAIARVIGVGDLVANERAMPLLGDIRRALEKVAALRPVNPRPHPRSQDEKRALDGLLDFAAHNGVFHLVNDARQDRE